MLKVVEKRDEWDAGEDLLLLDEIAREGAHRMLMNALKAEAAEYVEFYRSERDEHGHALVVRNGRTRGRRLTLGAGTVELKEPGVYDRRRDEHGQRQHFTSHIRAPYMRRSPQESARCCRSCTWVGYRRLIPPALEALLGDSKPH